MGRYYFFYPAWKNKDGTIEPLLWNSEQKPASIFYRSESFIEHKPFKELRMVNAEEFHNNCIDYFGHRYDNLCKAENKLTYVYELTQDWINEKSQTYGLVQGYVHIDEMLEYLEDEYPQEYYYWNMSTPLQAELVIELPVAKRDKYVKFAHVDTYSVEYICNILAETLECIYVPWDKKGEKIVLMSYSF